jgi:hypothetical protein
VGVPAGLTAATSGTGRTDPGGEGEAEPRRLSDRAGDAGAGRDLLHVAAARVGRLVAALKHQKEQTRAIRQAVDSLRGLPPFDT